MASQAILARVEISGGEVPGSDRLLTHDAVAFIASLHSEFEVRRLDLLEQRRQLQRSFDQGCIPDFLPETRHIRNARWSVAPLPDDMRSNGHPRVADLEDTLSPTWANIIERHLQIHDDVQRGRFAQRAVRPRGWHLLEHNAAVNGEPVSASLFDFGLFFFHNARALAAGGTTPVISLPKLESHQEARLWNDIFLFAQDAVGLPAGTVRATILVETLPAAFEMDEILFELRMHAAGLVPGRRDYTFSFIKKFRNRPELVLADYTRITARTPFIAAFTTLLQHTCARRGAHAWGTSETDVAASDRPAREVAVRDLLDPRIPSATFSLDAARDSIDVALRYLAAWLGGIGGVPIRSTTVDVATAEICRSQLWQWVRHEVPFDSGGIMTPPLYVELRNDTARRIADDGTAPDTLPDAAELLDVLVLARDFIPYLSFPAYPRLARREPPG